MPRRLSPRLGLAALLLAGAGTARADTVEVYSAGSLRGVVTALAAAARPMGIELHTTFDGAGALHARVDHGERPDLFLSADMAAPRALTASGRATVPAVAFARNRLCLVAARSAGLRSAALIETLLARPLRVKASQPKADPAGDYAMAMFDRIDARHPGAGAILRAEATQAAPAPAAAPGQNPVAALFLAHAIDVAITYCSAAAALESAAPGLETIAVPDDLDPHPVYGLALLGDTPSAARLALLLLSEPGQEIVARAGLLPLSAQAPR